MKPQESSGEGSALTREEEQAEVIRRLEEDIIFGRFAPGSRLVEDTLMTRYGASRHFVRQGLFQLERQGIVLREKNIGATVRFYSAEEVRQIYEVREMLTRQAALMIALPAPASLIEQLSELQGITAPRPTRRICAGFTKPTTPSTSRCSRPAAIPIWCARCRTT
jgi:DNA-binding GntR family transcriptional regulator